MANPEINGDMWDAYGKRWGNLEIFTILSTIASSSEKMIPVDFQVMELNHFVIFCLAISSRDKLLG